MKTKNIVLAFVTVLICIWFAGCEKKDAKAYSQNVREESNGSERSNLIGEVEGMGWVSNKKILFNRLLP